MASADNSLQFTLFLWYLSSSWCPSRDIYSCWCSRPEIICGCWMMDLERIKILSTWIQGSNMFNGFHNYDSFNVNSKKWARSSCDKIFRKERLCVRKEWLMFVSPTFAMSGALTWQVKSSIKYIIFLILRRDGTGIFARLSPRVVSFYSFPFSPRSRFYCCDNFISVWSLNGLGPFPVLQRCHETRSRIKHNLFFSRSKVTSKSPMPEWVFSSINDFPRYNVRYLLASIWLIKNISNLQLFSHSISY